MFRTYVISTELDEKINNSKLLQKYPELGERHLSGHYSESDVLSDIVYGPYNIRDYISQYALGLIGNDALFWKLFGEKTGESDLFGELADMRVKKANLTDISLGTGYLLPNPEEDTGHIYDEPKEFNKSELGNFKKYGFSSALEMIISLSAYRFREVLKDKSNQYEWVNSRGIRNVITACVHGDTKFYQYDENIPTKVISPYGNEVKFSPRIQIGSMTQVYHSHEPAFFTTFLRYAYECGFLKEIMGENGERLLMHAETLPGALGNYGDAGMESCSDYSHTLFNLGVSIGGNSKMRNTHVHPFGPNYNGKDEKKAFYEFKVGEKGELELHNQYSGCIDMVFYPEDCEDLIKGLLHQCAHGHGRTSKQQIIAIIKYMYSREIKNQADELGGFDLPNL